MGGGGVSVLSAASVQLLDVALVNNTATGQGPGGLAVSSSGSVDISTVSMTGNKVTA